MLCRLHDLYVLCYAHGVDNEMTGCLLKQFYVLYYAHGVDNEMTILFT